MPTFRTESNGSNRLGELLVADGLINREQLAHALDQQQRQGGLLGVILLQLEIIDQNTLATYLAKQAALNQ